MKRTIILTVFIFVICQALQTGPATAQSEFGGLTLLNRLTDENRSGGDHFGSGILNVGDVFNQGRSDYVIIDDQDNVSLYSLEKMQIGNNQTNTYWTQKQNVDYTPGVLTTDCSANESSVLERTDDLTHLGAKQFALSDPSATFTYLGFVYGRIGEVCVKNSEDGGYVSHIVGFFPDDYFGMLMTSLDTDLDNNGRKEMLIGAMSGLYLFDGKDISDYAHNGGFVPVRAVFANQAFPNGFLGVTGSSMEKIDTADGTFVVTATTLGGPEYFLFGPNAFEPYGQLTFFEIQHDPVNGFAMTERVRVRETLQYDNSLFGVLSGASNEKFGGSMAIIHSEEPDHFFLYVGVINASPFQRGQVFVYDLKDEGVGAEPRFTTQLIQKLTFEGVNAEFGWVVKALGYDHNFDGIEDIAVYDPGYNTVEKIGTLYLLSGADQTLLSTIENPADGYRANTNVVEGDENGHILAGFPLDYRHNSNGVVNDYVYVDPSTVPNSIALTATPNPVEIGGNTTIEWDASSRYVMCLSTTPEWLPGQDIGLSGSAEVPIHVRTNIKVICVNHGGYGEEKDLWINITFPPPTASEGPEGCVDEECPPQDPDGEEEEL